MKLKGFTLIELLVVVAIIGILATVVLTSLNTAREKARDAKRLADIRTIQNAMELYYLDNGRYPGSGWYYSNATSWATLETLMGGITLPEDPVDETGLSHQGALTYGYFASTSPTYCSQRAYMLVVNLETENDTSPGVQLCDDSYYGYTDSVVVGVDKNGNIVGPGV